MRKQKPVTVFDKEQYDGEWPPTDATDCVAWFAEKLETIPEEYRATAKIEFDCVRGYEDSHYVRISIYYERPETDDEMETREAKERSRQDEQKENELRELEALKAKYES